jgi:hypothetical protein
MIAIMIEKTATAGMQNHRKTNVSTNDVLTGNFVMNKCIIGKAVTWTISPYKNRKMVAARHILPYILQEQVCIRVPVPVAELKDYT